MTRIGFNRADIDGALADFGEAFDINRADLDRLMRQVELRALERTHGALRCADIMSRDVIRVDAGTDPAAARRLLIERNVRLLPVVDEGNRVLGCVGLRELERPGPLTAIMSQAVTARADTPAIGLIPPLTSGTVHAVVITDDAGVLAGVVTQTDLLAALARAPV